MRVSCPAVVYTGGEAARPFQADAHELSLFINEGHALFDLEIEGDGKVPVVVKEEQRHPVRGDLMHLDCQQVDLAQEIQADIAIELDRRRGRSRRQGGRHPRARHPRHHDRGASDAIPDEGISVDVSAMIIGDTIQLDTVEAPEGVKFVADNPEEVTIATLNPPKVVEEEPEVEEETEVIGEGEAEAEGESDGASGDSAATRATPAPRTSPRWAGFGRRRAVLGRGTRRGSGSADFLIVGLGNPGSRYAGTRHNAGFEVADALSSRWELPRAKQKFGGLITSGRIRPGGPRVAILLPQTFMNESGNAAGPARGSLGVPLDRVIALHDEIDLPVRRDQDRSSAAASPATTASRASSAGSAAATSGASGSASAAPTRPTPRSSPASSSGGSARAGTASRT